MSGSFIMPLGDGRQLMRMLDVQDPKLPLNALSGLSTPEAPMNLS